MYRILVKMKKMYNHDDWMKMVERGKLTDEEYQKLISMDGTEEE